MSALAHIIDRVRNLRIRLSYAVLPRDIGLTIDRAIALTYALETEQGWAQQWKGGETVTFYLPKIMLPIYDQFMDGTCLIPDDSVYEDAGVWDKDGNPL